MENTSSQHPLVSVLIPTFNQSDTILTAVNSALKQDYPSIEVIVCDDSENDSTEKILSDLIEQKEVIYRRNPSNLGRVANYRGGLRDLANGEYVLNLDGDDELTNDSFISKAVCIIQSDNEIVFVQGGEIMRTANGDQTKAPEIENDPTIIEGLDFILNFHKSYHFSHLASLYKREKAVEVNFYEHDILSTDIESFLKLAMNGKVALTRELAGVWNIHQENISQNSSLREQVDNLKFIDRIEAHLENVTGVAKSQQWKKDMKNELYSHITLSTLVEKRFFKRLGRLMKQAMVSPALFFTSYNLKTIFRKK